jgi:hypothetical protein
MLIIVALWEYYFLYKLVLKHIVCADRRLLTSRSQEFHENDIITHIHFQRYLSVQADDICLMEDREKPDNSTEDTTCGISTRTSGTDWLVPASLALTAIVAVNIYIVWYLLVAIPSGCRDLAARSNGSATCGIEPGAYILSGISVVIILVAVYAFVRWNMKRCRNRMAG